VKVLVTGATGFIGCRLVPALVREGHFVTAVGQRPDALAALGSNETIACDLRDHRATDRFPRRVDAVIHLAQANLTHPDEAALFATNAATTERLLAYAARAKISSFVLASSGSVYGGSPQAQHETDPLRGEDPYARSKLEAERLVVEHGGGFPAVILRLFAPYGPGQRRRLIPELISRVHAKRPVMLRDGGRPRLNPIYVDHVVDVLSQSLIPPAAQILNVAGDEVLSVREMADVIGRVLDTDPVFEEVDDEPQADLIGDTSAMRRNFTLPSTLVSFEQGVAATVRASDLSARMQ
jgi:UDP-glucose 4-epimerase